MPKTIVQVYLRGGHIVDVYCDDIEFSRDADTGRYTGYVITGGTAPMGFSPPDIVGWKQVQ